MTNAEKQYLRELAMTQAELANSALMKEREKMWYDHNECKGIRPMIAAGEGHYWREIWPQLQCEDPLAREMEYQLQNQIQRVELIGDDKVTPDFYAIRYTVRGPVGGLGEKTVRSETGAVTDGTTGYHIIPQIEIIEDDFHKLTPTQFHFPKEELEEKKARVEDIIGDILPAKLVNCTNDWGPSPMRDVIGLMGMENAYMAMAAEPEEFHRLMEFLTEEAIRLYRFEEESGCMYLNNRNHETGSGNWCFTRELPQPDFTGKVRSVDTWGHLNAEDSAEISPDMFREFVLPYQKRLAKEFGLIYYGCCEPASRFWENGIDQIENVRKLSISPWCDVRYMGERLAGKNIILSRKPKDYYYLGTQVNLDEEAFRQNIRETVEATKGCKMEYILRDVLTIHGNTGKVKRAIEIIREETEDSY